MAYTRDDEINDNSGRTWSAAQAPSGIAAIIGDEEIVRVHGHANFGNTSPRQVVNDGVSKSAVGYHCGHTQFTILRKHGLITKPRGMSYDVNLTKKGKRYYRALLADSAPQPERSGGAGWLIEIQRAGVPRWLQLPVTWVLDADRAIRFARKSDADEYIACHLMPDDGAFASEHQWRSAPRPDVPAEEG